jgi:hypothetical protein
LSRGKHNGRRRCSSRCDGSSNQGIRGFVRLETGEFSKITNRVGEPLIVVAQGGLFTKYYQYLISYKGLTFFTKSTVRLMLPDGAEVVNGGGIRVPGG